MRTVRLLSAFTFGVLLYQVAVVYVGGALAAVAIPKSYFDWFGRANAEAGLALLQLVSFAVPVSVLVAGGVLAVHRVLAGSTRPVLVAVLAGLVTCFLFWVVVPATRSSPAQAVEPQPPLMLLRQVLLPPWWALSGLLAPWVGFALGAWLLARKAARAVS
jgi:hypothetical protein